MLKAHCSERRKHFNQLMKFIGKNDLILLAVLIAAAVLMFFYKNGGFAASESKSINSGKTVIITVDDGTVYSRAFDELSLPETVEVDGYDGGHNTFVIDENADGLLEIYCVEADCPDKICVETGHISVPDQPVVCLPHRITARISKSS